MHNVFISYARADVASAEAVAEALRAEGYVVWRDDELPAHRPYSDVIEERLRASRAVVVLWSPDAIKSQWVRAEADLARAMGTLVQGSLDGSTPPLPFNQIQCADLREWPARRDLAGWQKILASVSELVRSPDEPIEPDRASHGPSIAVAAPVREKPLLLVEPLSVSPATGTDGIEHGFREAIVSALGQHPTLSVTGDTAGTNNAATPSHDCDADYVLGGALQRSGKRMRLSFRLTDCRSRNQLWAERYDADQDNLFDDQDHIALAVGGAVEAVVKNAEIERASRVPVEQLAMHQTYLRALGAQRSQDRAGYEAALAMFEAVIVREPRHRHALSNAALCHYNLHLSGWWDDEEKTRAAGTDHALRSLQLSDSDAYSAGLCALVLGQFDHPIDVSISLIDRLIGLNPALAVLWHWSGMLRLLQGEADRAEENFGRCIALDPRTSIRPIVLAGMGGARMLQGKHDQAIAVLQESIRLRGQTPLSRVFLAACHGLMGETDKARAMRATSEAIAPVERFRFPFRDADHRAMFERGLRISTPDTSGADGSAGSPHAAETTVQGSGNL